MEKFPATLVKDPRPLVFVIGHVEHDPSAKGRLISLMSSYLHETDQKDIPPIEFRAIKTHQYFPEKKSAKEIMSTGGILKLNWITKYNDILPSVVVLTFSFSAEWPITDWVKRESATLEYVTKVKNSLHSRDIKLILVPFRTGGGSHDVYEDRINAMKKRFQLDGRHLIVVATTDLSPPGTTTIKRLSKTVREFSMSYYVTHAKRVRNIEKSVKATEPTLIARYNFKVSFLSEFQGQTARALRHYRTAYSALAALYDEAVQQILPETNTDTSVYEQAKAVAEWINFKICMLYLKSNSLKEASQQLRGHITAFSKPVPGSSLWGHYAWVSDQYVIFAQTLDVCSTDPTLMDADRSYYYQNAALFATKRQSTFHGIKKSTEANIEAEHSLSHKYKGMVVTSPKYVGGPPQLHDPVLDIESNNNETDIKAIVDYLQRSSERKVDHKSLIIDLLKSALDALGPLQKRRRAMIRYQMAKQFMIQGKYELASMNLNPGIEILSKDNWSKPLVAMLRKKMACALYLGRAREYVVAALRLIAVAASKTQIGSSFGRHEREELHRDILSVIFSQGAPSPTYIASLLSDTSNAGVGYVGVTWRPQFGIAATEGHPAEYTLSGQHPIEFSDTGIDLFSVKTNFTPGSVAIGQSLRVTVTITSNFQGCLSFADMSLHFTDDVLVQKLTHDGSSAGDGDGGAIFPKGSGTIETTGLDGNAFRAALIFPPSTPVSFSMEVFVPESAIGSFVDAYACLEKIRLVMKIPNCVGSSSPSKTPGAAPPVVESVDSIINDSTKSFQPVVRRPSKAMGGIAVADIGDGELGNGEEIEVFVSAENKPLDEADAQFIPAADEGEDVQFSTPETPNTEDGGDGSGIVAPQRRRTSSAVSVGGAGVTDDFVEESIDSVESIPILTTRERMSSLSQMDLNNVMDNIDIAPLDAEIPLECTEERSDEMNDEVESDSRVSPENREDCDNYEEDNGGEDETARTSPAENQNCADDIQREEGEGRDLMDCDDQNPGEVTDSPFKSHVAPISEPIAENSVPEEDDAEVVPRDQDEPLEVDIEAVSEENVASAGTPMFLDERTNKFSDRDSTPIVSAGSEDVEEIPPSPLVATEVSVAAIVEDCEIIDNFELSGDRAESKNSLPASDSSPSVELKQGSPAEEEKQLSIAATPECAEDAYRHICFDIITVSRMFREARASATNIVLRDVADFVGPHAPKILHITRPLSHLKLLTDTSTAITSLQGMIHRVNLVFSTECDEMLDGKVYISSDQNPQTSTASLFWYPDINSATKSFSACEVDSSCSDPLSILTSTQFLEGVSFRPFVLNSLFQPAEPLSLPDCSRRSIFSVPLFLKSDTQGTFTVKLRFEYTPMSVLSTPVSKEFELKLSVHRPFALNFGFTSSMEAPCGAVLAPSTGASNQTQWRSVLRGDVINLSASLNCLNSLNRNIEVLALGVVVPSASKQLAADPAKPTVESVFQLIDSTVGSSQNITHSNRYANLLARHSTYSGGDTPLVMSANEKFVGSVEVKCLEKADSAEESMRLLKSPSLLLAPEPGNESGDNTDDAAKCLPLQPISIGNISIKWRTEERNQLCPIDLAPYVAMLPVESRNEYSIGEAWGGSVDPKDFSWLLMPCTRERANSDTVEVTTRGLVSDISRTLICSMTFMVPAIQVIDAPFKVEVDSPSVAEIGKPMVLTITVFNKLWSIERLCVSTALCNRFLITGCTQRTLEILPKGSIAVRYVLVPLLVGHCPMPTIRVTWEKTKTPVIEVGSSENPRHVFVMPASKQLAMV